MALAHRLALQDGADRRPGELPETVLRRAGRPRRRRFDSYTAKSSSGPSGSATRWRRPCTDEPSPRRSGCQAPPGARSPASPARDGFRVNPRGDASHRRVAEHNKSAPPVCPRGRNLQASNEMPVPTSAGATLATLLAQVARLQARLGNEGRAPIARGPDAAAVQAARRYATTGGHQRAELHARSRRSLSALKRYAEAHRARVSPRRTRTG